MALVDKPDVNKVWAVGGAIVEPPDSKKQLGWVAEVPPFQFENWIQNRQDLFNAHVNQRGIVEWDGETEYEAGRSYVQDPVDGTIYRCTVSNTNNIPSSSPGFWSIAFEEFGSGGGGGGGGGDVPPSAIMAFARATAPTGWLKANGAAISRETYADLFAAIGTTFGEGDGSTTFNLPDLRGEFVRGWSDGKDVDSGRVFGSSQLSANAAHTHTGTTVGGGLHSHTFSGTTGAGAAHGHQIQMPTATGAAQSGSGSTVLTGETTWVSTSNESAHTHPFSGTTTQTEIGRASCRERV